MTPQTKFIRMSARKIIESRLGGPLGPLATMPIDLRRLIYMLALDNNRSTPNVWL